MNAKLRLLALPAVAAVLALAGAAHAETSPAATTAQEAAKGVVGVCVRWGYDDTRLADVVVVEPSGDDVLDSIVPNTLRGMEWKKPQGYAGEWVALSVGVAGAQPVGGKEPSCAEVAAEAATPFRPLAVGKLTAA